MSWANWSGSVTASAPVLRPKTEAELGRSLSHKEGVDLVTRYVTGLKGVCTEDKGPQAVTAR